MKYISAGKLHQCCPQAASSSSLGTHLFPGLDKRHPMDFSQLLIVLPSIQKAGVKFFTQIIK